MRYRNRASGVVVNVHDDKSMDAAQWARVRAAKASKAKAAEPAPAADESTDEAPAEGAE